jgi:hypothetical protein
MKDARAVNGAVGNPDVGERVTVAVYRVKAFAETAPPTSSVAARKSSSAERTPFRVGPLLPTLEILTPIGASLFSNSLKTR